MMFTVDTNHLNALFLAIPFAFFVMSAFVGFSKKFIPYLLLFSFFPYVLTFISILLPQTVIKWALILFYLSGFLLFFIKGFPRIFFHKIRKFISSLSKLEMLSFLFIVLLITSKVLAATYFRDKGTVVDATTYHMGAAKEWVTYMSGANFNLNNPVLFTSSYWEYFNYSFVLPFQDLFYYLKALPQSYYEFLCYVLLLSAQIISAIFGFVLIPYLIYRIFNRERIYSFVAIAFLLSIRSHTWVWGLAKNNVYPVFVVIVAVFLLIEHYRNNTQIKMSHISLLAGVLCGISVGAKMTQVYALPFVAIACFVHYHKVVRTYAIRDLFRFALLLVCGGVIGISVLLLRNFLQTGNPIFPIDFLGDIPLVAESFQVNHYRYSHPSSWSVVLEKLSQLYFGNPILLVVSVLSLALRCFSFPIVFFLISLFAAKMTGPLSMWAHKSVVLVYLLPWCMELFRRFEPLVHRFGKKVSIAAVSGLFLLSPIHFENILKRPFERYPLKVKDVLTRNAYSWEKVYAENQAHYSDPCFVIVDEYGGYFSRFPFVNTAESNPKYRYDYCMKKAN